MPCDRWLTETNPEHPAALPAHGSSPPRPRSFATASSALSSACLDSPRSSFKSASFKSFSASLIALYGCLNRGVSGSARFAAAKNFNAPSASPRRIDAYAPVATATARTCPRRQSPATLPAETHAFAARSAERHSRLCQCARAKASRRRGMSDSGISANSAASRSTERETSTTRSQSRAATAARSARSCARDRADVSAFDDVSECSERVSPSVSRPSPNRASHKTKKSASVSAAAARASRRSRKTETSRSCAFSLCSRCFSAAFRARECVRWCCSKSSKASARSASVSAAAASGSASSFAEETRSRTPATARAKSKRDSSCLSSAASRLPRSRNARGPIGVERRFERFALGLLSSGTLSSHSRANVSVKCAICDRGRALR
mmetsp:Transcript_13761/g.57842  ORF Transcript_13761/g.57842 Transcript_13761/m.57842 type:complete len:380 (+) Transcript_13761:820-1959(+)